MSSSKSYALVTGASSGIGKAIAMEFARKQVNLLLVALPDTGLHEMRAKIQEEHKIDVKVFEGDLTDERIVHRVVRWVRQPNVAIRYLVNNAGVGTQSAFEDTSMGEIETMLKLNNMALVMLTYHLIPDLKSTSSGYILNVGSLASFMSIPGKAVYSASKSFIYSFSCSLGMELRPYNIKVSCLCPGGTLTSERVLENIGNMNFAGKSFLQQPADVAKEAIAQMLKGKRRIIPGRKNQILYWLWNMLPEPIVNKILLGIFFRAPITRERSNEERRRFELQRAHAIAGR